MSKQLAGAGPGDWTPFKQRNPCRGFCACMQVKHSGSLQSSHIILMIFKWCHAKLGWTNFSLNKSLFHFTFVCVPQQAKTELFLFALLDRQNRFPLQSTGYFSTLEPNAAEHSYKNFISKKYDWEGCMYELTFGCLGDGPRRTWWNGEVEREGVRKEIAWEKKRERQNQVEETQQEA